jgi:hypothetical protein
MSGTATTIDREHPIAVAAAQIEDILKTVRDAPAWSMNPEETRETLVRATRLTARVAELEARLADHARSIEVENQSGASSTATWWAHATKLTRAGAHRKTRLAAALASRVHEPVRVALADGVLLVDQAEVIIAAIDALPVDLVDDALRAEAQATLIGYAGVHDAKALRILGKRILEVVAPEVGEAWEAKKLADEEAEAEKSAVFRMHDDGHGKAHGRFTVPSQIGEMLRKALYAYAAPKHRAAVDGQAPEPGRPSPQRMGQAFCEYIAGYPTDHLPHAGGVNATVVVTMDLDTLLGGLKAAQLDTGLRISPGLARRLACEAGIIPAVLGSKSRVLDLGRKTRFHTTAQRIALALEHGGCAAVGCDAPPAMTHAHHEQSWATGGTTSVTNGRLLCGYHHARAHDPTYTMTKHPEGKVSFHRRT